MATGARILFNYLGVTLIEKMGHIGIDSRPLSQSALAEPVAVSFGRDDSVAAPVQEPAEWWHRTCRQPLNVRATETATPRPGGDAR